MSRLASSIGAKPGHHPVGRRRRHRVARVASVLRESAPRWTPIAFGQITFGGQAFAAADTGHAQDLVAEFRGDLRAARAAGSYVFHVKVVAPAGALEWVGSIDPVVRQQAGSMVRPPWSDQIDRPQSTPT